MFVIAFTKVKQLLMLYVKSGQYNVKCTIYTLDQKPQLQDIMQQFTLNTLQCFGVLGACQAPSDLESTL